MMPRKGPWKILGAGNFNVAYLSDDGTSVLKIQKKKINVEEKNQGKQYLAEMDTALRSVRIWNQLNPNLSFAAYRVTIKDQPAWVCPYIDGVQATDAEISIALLDIFNRSGRIVVDAMAKNNFLKTKDNRIVCIDVGMALQMELREDEEYAPRAKKWRQSLVSLNAWRTTEQGYSKLFAKHQDKYPATIDTIKALLFIKSKRPDIYDVTFLKSKPHFIKQLANAYDNQELELTLKQLDDEANGSTNNQEDHAVKKACDYLQEEVPTTFEHARSSCVNEIEKFISALGSFTSDGIFKPSFKTKFFSFFKENCTAHVVYAKNLITQIQRANTLEDIQTCIRNAQNVALKNKYGMGTYLGRCALILDIAKNEGLIEHLFKPKT